MLNTAGSLIAAERTGILSCTTYTAGVSGKYRSYTTGESAVMRFSGSCWALGVLHSGVAGSLDPYTVSQHIRQRIRVSYLDRSTLDALVTPPTNKVRSTSVNRICILRNI